MIVCLMCIFLFSGGRIRNVGWEGEGILEHFNGEYFKGTGEGVYGMAG